MKEQPKPPNRGQAPTFKVGISVGTILILLSIIFSLEVEYSSRGDGTRIKFDAERIPPQWSVIMLITVGAAFGIDVDKHAVYRQIFGDSAKK